MRPDARAGSTAGPAARASGSSTVAISRVSSRLRRSLSASSPTSTARLRCASAHISALASEPTAAAASAAPSRSSAFQNSVASPLEKKAGADAVAGGAPAGVAEAGAAGVSVRRRAAGVSGTTTGGGGVSRAAVRRAWRTSIPSRTIAVRAASTAAPPAARPTLAAPARARPCGGWRATSAKAAAKVARAARSRRRRPGRTRGAAGARSAAADSTPQRAATRPSRRRRRQRW